MPYDSSGNASVTRNIAVTGQTVLAEQVNVPFADIQNMLSQVLLRSGVAPMTGPLNSNNFSITNVKDAESSGDAVNFGQFQSTINSLGVVPTGAVQGFRLKTPPTGWVVENGTTIGNSSSGATGRANGDTLALFSLLWTNFTNTELPIQDSAGVASTRGASAALDFSANKRMPLFDSRTRFQRGSDSGLAYDATLTVGLAQDDLIKSHNHTTSVTGDTTHRHSVTGVNPGGSGSTGVVSGAFTGNTDAALNSTVPLPTVTVNNTGGTETRPRSTVVLFCIKL